MKLSKIFWSGTLTWLAILIIDCGVEFILINDASSSEFTTRMGLKISTFIGNETVSTHFNFTWQMLIIYIGFMAIWLVVSFKRSKSHNTFG